jgi:3-mercaptopyruvate sulfurtransferase SseA
MAGMADVMRAMKDPGIALVDCRSPEEWRGGIGRGQRKGRIPVSKNALRLAGFPGRDQLRRLLVRVGVGSGESDRARLIGFEVSA